MVRLAALAFVVAFADNTGTVVVDGRTVVPLEDGVAHLVLGPGDHSVEVVPNAIVKVPFPTRKVIAGTLLGLGAISLVVSLGFWHQYTLNQDGEQRPELRALYPSTQTPDSLCSGSSHAAALDEVCRLNDESKKHSILAIVNGANGLFLVTAGLLTWFTGTKEVPVTPVIGRGSAGLATFLEF